MANALADQFAYLRHRADVLKCCGNPDNLIVQKERADLLVATCKKCLRRHKKLFAEPGHIELFRKAKQLEAKPIQKPTMYRRFN